MRALVWHGGSAATDTSVVDVPEASAEHGQVLIDVAWFGMCGTDLHITDGTHPRARPGLVLGHEMVGRLVQTGAGLDAGTPVFVNPLLVDSTCRACRRGLSHVCEHLGLVGIDTDGGAAERVAVGADALVPLPPDLDLQTAALIEPTAVAVRAIRRSGLQLGDVVHVLGAGPIGLLVAQCARLAGAGVVTLSEPSPSRAVRATGLGFAILDEADATADVVLDCTGHPAVSPGLTRWAATGATVVVTGVYPGVVGVDLQDVLFRELTLVGTRVYTPADVDRAVSLLARGHLDTAALVTRTATLEDAPAVLQDLRAGRELKVLFAGPAA